MNIGVPARVATLLAVILTIGLGITGVLSVQTFNRTLAEFLSTRFEFVVTDLRQRIETQMDLGLALSNIENIPSMMQTYLEDDPQIFTIEVFDRSGTVLYSTDTSFEGDLVVENWLEAWKNSGRGGIWSLFERDAGVVGAVLRDNFDQEIGSIALRYSRDFLDDTVDLHGNRLLFFATANIAVITLMALLGALFILRRPLKNLDYLGFAVLTLSDRRSGTPVEEAAGEQPEEFETFATEVCTAQDMITEATGKIRQLDEEQVSHR